MKPTSDMTPAELRKAAIDAIVREVGVVGYIRFMQDVTHGSGDYAVDRDAWLPLNKPIRELVKEIERESR